jgi:hypothetical protein
VQDAMDEGQNRSNTQKECNLHRIVSCSRSFKRSFSRTFCAGLGTEVWPNMPTRASIV